MTMSGDQFVEWLDQELEPLRREIIASPYYDAWCSGKLSNEQVFQVMSQWYAYLRQIPSILSAWMQRCPDADLGLKYIDYTHEEAPHPEYLIEFAKEIGRDPEEMRGGTDSRVHHSVFLLLAFARSYRRDRRRQ